MVRKAAKKKASGTKSLRILIANDDGIQSAGIKALTRVAQTITDDVWVVAPEVEQSAASHSLTVRRPLRVKKLAPRRFAVDGTPTDCVMLAVLQILEDKAPDLVLSGFNNGSNLAEDIAHSGTVAAASMGAVLGIRSMALSQVTTLGQKTKWSTSETLAPDLIRKLLKADWARDSLININFPDLVTASVKGIWVTCQGRRRVRETITESSDPFGRPYFWIGGPRTEKSTSKVSDITAINEGAVSVTPLRLDLTQEKMLSGLRKVLG
ncbi:MAG TPA: 5'/3'-nucleotidase SurE [Alphaproteobacteria bacterium]|nr:5'/3'-nucleotidase SurE [Alphaproteobacteria bacterium]